MIFEEHKYREASMISEYRTTSLEKRAAMQIYLLSSNLGDGLALEDIGKVCISNQFNNIVTESSGVLLLMQHTQDFPSLALNTTSHLHNVRALVAYTLHLAPTIIPHFSPSRLDVNLYPTHE